MIAEPVSEDPRLEARLLVREQSVSVAYHRHGNLTLRGIHPLLGGLPQRAERLV